MKWVARAALLCALLSLSVWCAVSWHAPHGRIVEVIRDGKIAVTIDLSGDPSPRTLTLTSPDGGFNTLQIKNGRIRVLSADCPGNDCVKMGWLRSVSSPLVCMPHRLVVRFAPASAGELDGVSQ